MRLTLVTIVLFSGFAFSFGLSDTAAEDLNLNPFLTRIATSSVEAARFQLMERAALPSNYRSFTSFAEKPILIEVGSEITETVLVGRYVSFDFDKGVSTAELKQRIEWMCQQVPYSGWREHAAIISDKFGTLWDELRTVPPMDESKVERTCIIDYYTLKFYVRNRLSDEKLQQVSISLCVTDMVSLNLRAMKSLAEDAHLWLVPVDPVARIYEPAADSQLGPYASYLQWLEQTVASGDFFKGQILPIDASRPILIRHAAPRDSAGWCLLIAEQRSNSEDRAQLIDSVKSTLIQRMQKAKLEYSGDALNIPEGECNDVPLQVQPLQMLVSRSVVDGFDRIEVKYRVRRPN